MLLLSETLQASSNEMSDVPDLSWWVTRLYSKVRKSQADLYIKGIARGIAMHHSGLPKAYRDLVEAFTRSGIITVVIATRSLAVGVNFPIRTAVFLDPSTHMDSTSFRQMCGRAGRRGFDECGYIVTIGLSLNHLATLVISPAHKLVIPFGLDVNSLLRMLIMRQGRVPGAQKAVENTAYVQNVIRRWMLLPGQTENSPATSAALWGYHFFHQLLYGMKLIDGISNPIGLAGLVSHCGEHYPANLAFAYLLLTGSLARALRVEEHATQDLTSSFKAERLRVLKLVYVHVMSRSLMRQDHGETSKTATVYTLPEVPIEVQTSLREYNKCVQSTFRDCERVFGAEGALLYEPFLPLVSVGSKSKNGYLYLFMTGTRYDTILKHCQMTDKVLFARLASEFLFMRKVVTALTLCLDYTEPLVADMRAVLGDFEAKYNDISY